MLIHRNHLGGGMTVKCRYGGVITQNSYGEHYPILKVTSLKTVNHTVPLHTHENNANCSNSLLCRSFSVQQFPLKDFHLYDILGFAFCKGNIHQFQKALF